ncbi:thiaminase II/PqqC family protein [Limnochorda pilosa]|uniref:Aminopyrimidine aminohydrolase n=1 Tax=Limnochorda pilosa TaxID=1555112 RepID=A0A0K2SHN3_LIMPI|nr:hypothetical protein [Limnochorda pilosa]BAS26626.1 thiaminase [Limnochorda pilosa]
MSFTQELRRWVDPIWQASFEHPFITGLADGTLPLDRFRFYVQQDSYYLTEFGRVLAVAASRAGDLAEASELAAHVRTTWHSSRGWQG